MVFQRICSTLHYRLLQEAPIRLRQTFVVVWLERQPSLLRHTDLLIAVSRLLIVDERLLMPAALLSSVNKQLCMAGLVKRNEPEGRCVDRLANLATLGVSNNVETGNK